MLVGIVSMSNVLHWKSVPGATRIKRRLSLVSDAEGIFRCPVTGCEHEGFRSQRGCRKHVCNTHPWYYYFEKYPSIVVDNEPNKPKENESEELQVLETGEKATSVIDIVVFSEKFAKWMCSSTGGARTKAHANQISSRVIKFVNFCYEEAKADDIQEKKVDYYLASTEHLASFLEHLEQDRRIGYAGGVSYISALLEIIEYRKCNGVSTSVLNNFTVAESFLKRAKRCMARKMRVQWHDQLDVETLERKGHWASIKDLQRVIPYHFDRYKNVMEECKNPEKSVNMGDLIFCTRFITTFLFLRVKGTRPMTYQYLTVSMVEDATKNGGFIDQRKFKTAAKYGFDSVVVDDTSLQILTGYIKNIRSLLHPKTDRLLVNRNGDPFTRLHQAMGILVYEAIGKYVHPTRYRQIIKTESAACLNVEDREAISEDQKHTSNVARIHYRKNRSRSVAQKGHSCIKKLRGDEGVVLEKTLKDFIDLDADTAADSDIFITQNKFCTSSSEVNNDINLSEENGKTEEKPSHDLTVCKQEKQFQGFSAMEDSQLIEGIKKHGYGHWGIILKDCKLKFTQGRTRNSLLRRARTNKFKDLYFRCCGQTLS